MNFRFATVLIVSAAILGSGAMAVSKTLAPKREPKSIKEVMKLAHKDGLLKKIQGETASDEEKLQLLDLYIDMLEGEPKKGDPMEWKAAAGASVVSAAKVVIGREGALDELKTSTECKACHDKFK